MYSNLTIKGPVLKVIEKEYQGKVSYSLQFMTQDNEQGFKIIPVKVDKELLPANLKDNDIVEIDIKISSMNNNLFYSAVNKIKINQK